MSATKGGPLSANINLLQSPDKSFCRIGGISIDMREDVPAQPEGVDGKTVF
jgi:hypothetical protein